MYPSLYKGLQVAVRIANHLAVESIRNLNTSHINKLIVVEGVCMRRSDVLPRLDVVWYECVRCGCDTNGPFDQRAVDIEKLTREPPSDRRELSTPLCAHRDLYELSGSWPLQHQS